jgi:hypothetical protein
MTNNHTENPQAALYSALAQFQHAARVVVADRVNKAKGNRYASTSAVLDELRPIAARLGLAIMTPPAGCRAEQQVVDSKGRPDFFGVQGVRIIVTHTAGGFADFGVSEMFVNAGNGGSGNDKSLSAQKILQRQIWLGLAGATVVDEAPREYYQAPQDNEAEARRNAIADARAEIQAATVFAELDEIYAKYKPIWGPQLTDECEKWKTARGITRGSRSASNQAAARAEVDAMAGDNVEFAS